MEYKYANLYRTIKIIFKYGRLVKHYNRQIKVSYWLTAQVSFINDFFIFFIYTVFNTKFAPRVTTPHRGGLLQVYMHFIIGVRQ